MVLLVLIGVLIKDNKHSTWGKERAIAIAGEEIQEDYITETASVEKEEEEAELQKEEHTEEDVSGMESNAQPEEISTISEKEAVEVTGTVSGNAAVANNSLQKSVEEDITKIVVFGDSIWDSERGEDGISERVMEQLDVVIYNCAVGGTAAAIDGEAQSWDNWTSDSFNGMMYIANDIISADDLIPETDAYDVITKVDFNEVDYVIVSYGLNDYFSDIPIYPQTYYDTASFVGALRHGIQKLREEYPQLKFILTSPTYCEWFKGERQFELGAYTEAARSVAKEMDTYFLDMYHALGKTPEEKMEYLSDGVHLNEDGRRLYAHSVIEYLKELEMVEKNID